MILYILRHGAAENEPPPGGDDGARRLTARGREKVRDAAAGMRALGVKFDAILTSPLPRAAETAELVAAVYANGPAPEVFAALATGVTPADTIAALKPYERHHHLMIVGHEPGLSGVASLLLTGSTNSVSFDLKKCGMIALELDDGIERGSAQLLWMLTSRQLRRLHK
ncbi:MAG TPA: phosphohistidine phosphatase SixA [Candidatus Binataceae bacterium]|jgi:phosphohistidine phosphatase|nr:phosphohistidine phosphatase SixA [Candidatus Binataceae bacterium]